MSTNERLVPGMVLGRYELLLPIAQGGMATVWAARQKGSRGFQKTVAIKTMLPNLSDDPMFEQMFLDEAALAAKIHHPNVAEILDLGEQDEIIYLVMEWVDGEALSVLHKATRRNQLQFPHRIALRVAVQACAGLHAAHELRDEEDTHLELVHRDVSPQNILVTYDGIVKIVDFGVAKSASRAAADTSAGRLKGKVPYMSPEQARGAKVDRRSDIFAMGIVLYKLTTGLHPFSGDNDLVTMRNIISRPLLPARVKAPQFPEELDQVLTKCLQKDPDKRYQTVLELGSALERALGSMGIADDDVGGFVRSQLGERGAKRRAALRDAVRIADERLATGAPPAPLSASSMIPRDSMSELLVTGMNTSVKPDFVMDRASTVTVPDPQPHSLSSSGPPPRMSEQSPVAVELPELRRNRSGLFVGLGVAAAAAAIAFALLHGGGSHSDAVPGASVPGVSGPAAAARPAPSSLAAKAASEKPVDAPAAPTVSALRIDDLPNVAPNVATDSPKKVISAGAKPAAEPKVAPPVPSDSAPKPPRPASTHWVPAVQNPGF